MKVPLCSGDKKMLPGETRCGRRGLPQAWVDILYADYLRLHSLSRTAALHGRTRQALYDIFKHHGLKCYPKHYHGLVEYRGRKFTPGKNGYLRDTAFRSTQPGIEVNLHRQVWLDHFGPIPPRHEVGFKDGDKTNCRIENLICLPKGELSRRKSGGRNQHTTARGARFAQEHTGFIVKTAQWFWRPGLDMDELIQVGRLAVLQANKTYRPSRAKFLSYAARGIRQAMGRFVRAHGKAVRVPASQKGLQVQVVSLEAPLGGAEDLSLQDVLSGDGDPGQELQAGVDHKALVNLVRGLPERERYVLEQRFWRGRSTQEIAADFGISHQAVHQTLLKALQRLRKRGAWLKAA